MPSAHKHYMMDCFYLETGQLEAVCKEKRRIVALSDDGAIWEAEAIADLLNNLAFFHLRVVTRKDDRVIYKSSNA